MGTDGGRHSAVDVKVFLCDDAVACKKQHSILTTHTHRYQSLYQSTNSLLIQISRVLTGLSSTLNFLISHLLHLNHPQGMHSNLNYP